MINNISEKIISATQHKFQYGFSFDKIRKLLRTEIHIDWCYA